VGVREWGKDESATNYKVGAIAHHSVASLFQPRGVIDVVQNVLDRSEHSQQRGVLGPARGCVLC
jgi:hypothetical protein